MNGIGAGSSILLLVDFLFGVTFGVIGSASLASRREDYDYSLTHAPPDPVSDGARVIYGVYTRGSGPQGQETDR